MQSFLPYGQDFTISKEMRRTPPSELKDLGLVDMDEMEVREVSSLEKRFIPSVRDVELQMNGAKGEKFWMDNSKSGGKGRDSFRHGKKKMPTKNCMKPQRPYQYRYGVKYDYPR